MREIIIILFCTWKFALTFPIAVYGMNMSFAETVFYTNIGGLMGVVFFTLLSKQILQFWSIRVQPIITEKRVHKPVFSKRRRQFIKIKNKYGLSGIIILNPIILSIPISAFLVVKYYGRKKRYLLWLVAGQFAWSLIYTYFYLYIKI